MAAFLVCLERKGATADELYAFAKVMRDRALDVPIDEELRRRLLDTCGTGGDRQGTFNISTTSMFVAHAAGIPIAKHGNRSVTSRSGSADLVESLGIPVELGGEEAAQALNEVGFAFLFAPKYHPAMRHVMPVRRKLAEQGLRTVFNLLGPLANPAGAGTQLLGVYDPACVEVFAHVLARLGIERALVVHGTVGGVKEGLDEISLSGPTHAFEVNGEELGEITLTPEDVGLSVCSLGDLKGGSPEENREMTLGILRGEARGPKADAVAFNAGAAIYLARADVQELRDGVEIARDILITARAYESLEKIRSYFGGGSDSA